MAPSNVAKATRGLYPALSVALGIDEAHYLSNRATPRGSVSPGIAHLWHQATIASYEKCKNRIVDVSDQFSGDTIILDSALPKFPYLGV